jgi:hypothetical protein
LMVKENAVRYGVLTVVLPWMWHSHSVSSCRSFRGS